VCATVNVEPSGVEVQVYDNGSAANTALTGNIWCDNKNNPAATVTCQQATFTDAQVYCDSGACRQSDFTDSTVDCDDNIDDASCFSSEFRRSTVNCFDNSCDDSLFVASAVYCEQFSACSGETYFRACSCCDGYYCSEEPSCVANPLEFCQTQFLGRTCAEWGNPVCEAYTIGKFQLVRK